MQTIEECLKNELAVLLDQVVDVAKNSTGPVLAQNRVLRNDAPYHIVILAPTEDGQRGQRRRLQTVRLIFGSRVPSKQEVNNATLSGNLVGKGVDDERSRER